MITDGQLYFSDLASGDKPTAVGDTASANVLDQQVKGGPFTEGGGAEKALWLKAIVNAAVTSGGLATVQAVLQDSPDDVTWTDQLLGPAVAKASLVAGADLFQQPTRMPSKLARYIRLVYRVGTAILTAGTFISFLTPDQDVFDASQRAATGTVSEPTGALDESGANGVLGG